MSHFKIIYVLRYFFCCGFRRSHYKRRHNEDKMIFETNQQVVQEKISCMVNYLIWIEY